MNRLMIALFLSAFVALASFTVSGQAPDKPRKGFLSAITEGQSVTLKDNAGRFEISMFDDGPAIHSHKIIEVGQDWLTVEDIAGVTQTRISVYAIKSFVKIKVPRK